MNVIWTHLDRDFLLSIPDSEATLFPTTANLANELNVFMRLVLWSAEIQYQEPHETNGRVAMMFMMLRRLSGKVYEGHQTLDSCFQRSGLSRDYFEKLTPEGQEALTETNRYFKKSNLIHRIRRDFAFHFSPDEIRGALENVDESLLMSHQEDVSINNLYYLAEVLVNRAMLQAVEKGDFFEAVRSIQGEVLRVGRQMVVSCDAILAAFFHRHVPEVWAAQPERLVLTSVPHLASISFPWFVDMADLVASA